MSWRHQVTRVCNDIVNGKAKRPQCVVPPLIMPSSELAPSSRYKQQKFNLLREETEGYSKLEVELLSGMGRPHDSRTARPAEP